MLPCAMGCTASSPTGVGAVKPRHIAQLSPIDKERRCREIRLEVSSWVVAVIGILTLITAIAIHVHVVTKLPLRSSQTRVQSASVLGDSVL